MKNAIKKTFVGGLAALVISLSTPGCWKKPEKIEPFIGTIMGERMRHTGFEDIWSIYVSSLDNKKAKLFSYYLEDSRVQALDDAFDKGDMVEIEQWTNGKYSCPKPYSKKEND